MGWARIKYGRDEPRKLKPPTSPMSVPLESSRKKGRRQLADSSTRTRTRSDEALKSQKANPSPPLVPTGALQCSIGVWARDVNFSSS